MSQANRGKPWETLLIWWHDLYLRDGRASITKADPPIIMRSKMVYGQFKASYAKRGAPDFSGVVMHEGRGVAVCFDAKRTKAKRFPLKAIEAHQAKSLDDWQACGGFAFIALESPHGRYVLPWKKLGPLWHRWKRKEAPRGGASLGAAELAEVGRPMNDDGWIGAALGV
jgi:recombination protein U